MFTQKKHKHFLIKLNPQCFQTKNNNMKNIKRSLVLIAVLTSLMSCNNNETQTVITKTQLVLAEEFDSGTAPNSSIWSYDIGTGSNGWGNNEFQYYTNRPQNIKIENGVLKITAIKEQFMGSGYTAARILTKGKFEQKYGRIEARIKMPLGKGLWPAFWMLGANSNTVIWPQCGEIDIMEYLGNNPTTIFGTVHGPGYYGGNAVSKNYSLPNNRFDNDFHIFGIEWDENQINYYVDNVLYNQITPAKVPGEWVFNQPFYIILNMAVGGNFPGPPNAETVFPQTMQIDYIRVYQ
jgi:beta-glucanase (GH16 family)